MDRLKISHIVFVTEDLRNRIENFIDRFNEVNNEVEGDPFGEMIRSVVAPIHMAISASKKELSHHPYWKQVRGHKIKDIFCSRVDAAEQVLREHSLEGLANELFDLREEILGHFYAVCTIKSADDARAMLERIRDPEQKEEVFTMPILLSITEKIPVDEFLAMYEEFGAELSGLAWEPFDLIHNQLNRVETVAELEGVLKIAAEKDTPFFHPRLLSLFNAVTRSGMSKEELVALPRLNIQVNTWNPVYGAILGQGWGESSGDVEEFRKLFCSLPTVRKWVPREDESSS